MNTLLYDASLLQENSANTSEIRWPYTAGAFERIINGHLAGILKQAENSESDFHYSVLLMSVLTMNPLWSYCEKALCVQFERDQGVHYSGNSPILEFLRGIGTLPDKVGSIPGQIVSPTPPRHPKVRSAINTWQMTRLGKFPQALISPDVEVGTIGALICEYSLRNHSASLYNDSNKALLNIRRSNKAEGNSNVLELVVGQLVTLVTNSLQLDDPLMTQFQALVRHQIRPLIGQIIDDVSRVQKTRKIPKSYWSGSGGKYSSRLISIECLRRGGDVTRFDHAGSMGFLDMGALIPIVEMSVSNRYVMATAKHAALTKEAVAGKLSPAVRQVEIVGGYGYSHIGKLDLTGSRRKTDKPRVMYVSSFSGSKTKNATHFFSELIYQDWSTRLAKQLSKLSIDLVCKPHPDFLPSGRSHPISEFSSIIDEPFEAVINDADIFIYDCFNSTTFWEAVCTDKKIVCIDIGFPRPTEAARPILDRRCTFIKAKFDEANRLQIDPDELEDAILGTTIAGTPDELRNILIGT